MQNSESHKALANLILYIMLLLLTIVVIVDQMNAPKHTSNLPLNVALIIFVLLVINIIKTIKGQNWQAMGHLIQSLVSKRNLIIIIASLPLFIVVQWVVGYSIAIFLYLLTLNYLLAEENSHRIRRCLKTSIITWLCLWLIFIYLLHIPVPTGLIFGGN